MSYVMVLATEARALEAELSRLRKDNAALLAAAIELTAAYEDETLDIERCINAWKAMAAAITQT